MPAGGKDTRYSSSGRAGGGTSGGRSGSAGGARGGSRPPKNTRKVVNSEKTADARMAKEAAKRGYISYYGPVSSRMPSVKPKPSSGRVSSGYKKGARKG